MVLQQTYKVTCSHSFHPCCKHPPCFCSNSQSPLFGKQIKLCPVYIPYPLVNIFNPLPVNISIILQTAFVNPHAVNITLLHSSHDSLLFHKHKQHFAVAIFQLRCKHGYIFRVNILTCITHPFVT